MASEYNEILESERTLLESFISFYQKQEEEPLYEDYDNKGAFSFYDKGNWQTIANRAFALEDYANIGQSFTRRESVDELICKDRTFLIHSYDRKDFYDLEEKWLEFKLRKIDFDITNYTTAIQSYDIIVPYT
jgi:hypothetical protein